MAFPCHVAICKLGMLVVRVLRSALQTNHLDTESVAWLEQFLASKFNIFIAIAISLTPRLQQSHPCPVNDSACLPAAAFPGTVVAVTHDRYFLDNVAGWILELDRGKGIPFEGNYSEWLEAKAKRLQVTLAAADTDSHASNLQLLACV